MEKHNKTNLSEIGDFASVQSCGCCNCKNDVLHINFYNTTMRLTKEYFKAYVTMLNEAMFKIDENGEFREELEGIYNFYNFLGSDEGQDENNKIF
ncbi:MAG: hypothetical protein PQJ46_09680 [Spirochaetales bacterium]|nr:hypothetical protein [Spirochaetales bacterium]